MKHLQQKYDSDRGNALIVTVIAMPLIMLILSTMLNIGVSISTKNIFTSAANSAAEAAVKTANNDVSLGNLAVTKFVQTYRQLASNTQGVGMGQEAEALGNKGECSVMEVNGVERQLPYMEITLSENRGFSMNDQHTTAVWKVEGNTELPEERNLGNIKYKVITADVWNAVESNFLGYSGSGNCHLQKVTGSAIAFASQTDLEDQIAFDNRVTEAKDIDISFDTCDAGGSYYTLMSVQDTRNTLVIDSVKDKQNNPIDYKLWTSNADMVKEVPFYYNVQGTQNIVFNKENYDLNNAALEGDFEKVTYIEYHFEREVPKADGGTELKKSTSAIITFRDDRPSNCAFSWPDIDTTRPWVGAATGVAGNGGKLVVPKEYIDIRTGALSEFKIMSEPTGITLATDGTDYTVDNNRVLRRVDFTRTSGTTYVYNYAMKLQHLESRQTKTYNFNIYVHPLASSAPTAKSVPYKATPQDMKYVQYPTIPDAMKNYFSYTFAFASGSSWLQYSMMDKEYVTLTPGSNPYNQAASVTANYVYEIKTKEDIGLKNSAIEITMNIPAPSMTYGKSRFDSTNGRAEVMWAKATTTAAKNDIIARYETLYGADGLTKSLCSDTNSVLYYQRVGTTNDIALTYKRVVTDFTAIQADVNASAHLKTLLSASDTNLACYKSNL